MTKQLSMTQISVTALMEESRHAPQCPPTSCVLKTESSREVCIFEMEKDYIVTRNSINLELLYTKGNEIALIKG